MIVVIQKFRTKIPPKNQGKQSGGVLLSKGEEIREQG